MSHIVNIQVRRDATRPTQSVLVFGDDPHGWAASVKREWVVTHKILTGVYDESQAAVRKLYTVIRVGDFVEVVASVEVVKYRKYQRWITEARLILQEVLRICEKNTVLVSIVYYSERHEALTMAFQKTAEVGSSHVDADSRKEIHTISILGSPRTDDVEMIDASVESS